MQSIKDHDIRGVWPVMITPFTDTGKIDYAAVQALIEWYQEKGANGIFAVCQSSEMFFLSLRERVELVSFIKKHSSIPIIASGHISYGLDDQVGELRAIADAGADSVILVTNRLAENGSKPEVWKRNLEYILSHLDESVPLGFYECPYPYKRLISLEELKFCADTGRFLFMKDTCCDISLIHERLEVLKGSSLRLFNANSSTLLESLKYGSAGFSGVMANFHPELYVWLMNNWEKEPAKAETLQSVLTLCSMIEKQLYPTNAKWHLHNQGLPMTTYSRTQNFHELSPLFKDEVAQMSHLIEWVKSALAITL